MNGSSHIDLPAEIVLRICNILSSLDLVNICTAIPYWRQVIDSPTGIRFFQRDLVTWKWLDQRLSRLLLSQSSHSYFNNLLDAIRYHNERNADFHQQWASFSLPEKTKSVQCVLLGPAVDASGLFSGFFDTLLQAMDFKADSRLHSLRLTPQPIGWTGHGLPIRLPMSGKKNSSGTMVVRVTTLHARDKRSREIESSRVSGTFIISNGQLTPESASVIALTGFVIYAVDCRRGMSPWDEIRTELEEIVQVMTAQQTLLVLGLCRKDQCGADLLSATEIVQELGGIDNGPLALVKTNWRVWCVASDGRHYTNLNEIFEWAFMDVYLKTYQNEHFDLMSMWSKLTKLF